MTWKGFYSPKLKKTVSVDGLILDTYVGDYKVNNVTFSFKKEGDGLATVQNGKRMKVYFTSNSEYFIIEAPDTEFSFLKDVNNNVIGVQQKRGNNIIKASKVL